MQSLLAVATGIWPFCLRSAVWGRHRAEAGERTAEVTKAQEARSPEGCRLTLFHQKRPFSSFAPRRPEELEQHPEQAQHGAHQQQLQAREEGIAGLPLPGLSCPSLLCSFLPLQNLHRIHMGPGVESSHELLVHEALVNGWPEDLQPPAPSGGVQDGAQVLAGELALPGQGLAVGLPDDGPAEEDKVSGSPQGGKDKCPREVETAAPPRGTADSTPSEEHY